MKYTDALILTAFGLLVLGWACYDISNYEVPSRQAFGAEYGMLAENMVSGNGFSGPFGRSIQPSAWMPPLLPAVIAVVFLLFGTGTLAAAFVLLLLDAVFTWTALFLIFRATREMRSFRWVPALIFALCLWLQRLAGKEGFHDTGWTMMLSCLAVWSLLELKRGEYVQAMLTVALLPLSSPAIALAYLLLLPLSRAPRRTLLLIAACWLGATGVWTVRNAVVLGGLIPVKSNLWFDFQQANVADADGVPTSSTFIRNHPALQRDIGEFYAVHGERELIGRGRAASFQFLREHPADFVAKVMARLQNACIFMRHHGDLIAVNKVLSAELQALLVKKNLVLGAARNATWTCLDQSEKEVAQQMSTLPEQDREWLLNDWKRARFALDEWRSRWYIELWGLMHSLLPTLAVVAGWLRPSVRKRPAFQFASLLYLIYLTPYILVSHYQRYSESLAALVALLVWLNLPQRTNVDSP